MKSYGKRFLKNRMRSEVEQKTETRNAIVWNIYPTNKYCEVKIQGSNELIRAYYPIGWEKTPSYVKKGGCVLIAHTGGNRGRIEVAGMGILIPAAVSGDDLPEQPIPDDAVLTGLQVKQITNGNWMRIWVTVGTVRFSNNTNTVGPIAMGNTNFVMGMGMKMGGVAYVSADFAAPGAGTYRYDLIVIGSNLAIDIVTGTASSSPVMPSTPSGHLLLGWILFYPGMTKILQSDIGRTYGVSQASSLVMTIADDDLAWAEGSTTITVAVFDQYGNPCYQSGSGWYMTLQRITGSGDLSVNGCDTPIICPEGASVSWHSGSSSNQVVFKYTRSYSSESSPLISARTDGVPDFLTARIILRDSGGNQL